jgi:hypothetical protein
MRHVKKIILSLLFFSTVINTSHAEVEKTTTHYEFSLLGGYKSAYGWAGLKFGVNVGQYFQCTAGAGIGKLQSRVCAGFNIYPFPQAKIAPYITVDYSYALSTKIANDKLYETYTIKGNHYITPCLSVRCLLGTSFALKLKAGYSFLLSNLDKTVIATAQNKTQLQAMRADLSGGFCVSAGISISFRLKQKAQDSSE